MELFIWRKCVQKYFEKNMHITYVQDHKTEQNTFFPTTIRTKYVWNEDDQTK